LKEEVTNPPTQVNLIDDDYGIILELFSFANIKKEVCDVLGSFFLFFFFKFEKEKFTTCCL
jgi:hypothetical protein